MGVVGNALVWPFWDRGERRLRWGWRFFIPIVLSIVLILYGDFFATPLFPLLERLTPGFVGISDTLTMMATRTLIVLVVLILWARFVDRRRIADYGFHVNREWWIHLAGGMLIGASVGTGVLVVSLVLGWATVADVADLSAAFAFAFVVGIFASLLNGLWEETLYRGMALKNAAEGLRSVGISPRVAVLGAWMLVSLAFTLFHIFLGAGFSTFLFYVVGSLAIGFVYVFTGELAFPIGYHAMLNYFLGVVFSIYALPGVPTVVGLEVTDSAPQLFLGEAALLITSLIALSVLLMLAWVRWRKGNFKIKTDLTEWTPRGAQKPHGSGRVR